MAICYARMEFVKRSARKNAVAKSAYNGKLKLEFYGNVVLNPHVYDWSRGDGKSLYHGIMLPNHASPEFKNPQILWNAVEKFEKRKDAQVGKEIVLAIPDDNVISDNQRIEMTTQFVNKFIISKGYGAQVDIHYPSQQKSYNEENMELEKNDKNHHAHILITPRILSEDGKSFNKKKTNELTPSVRGGYHLAFGGIEWPKLWTQFQNEFFEERGLDLRVDQTGIISQVHLGPVRMRSQNSYKILEEQDNLDKINQSFSKDPNLILQKLTENKSVFGEKDVEFLLQKHLLENEIGKVRESFWKNPQLLQLFDKNSLTATSRFSSVEVVEEEKRILRLADRINQKQGSANSYIKKPENLNSEQLTAFDRIVKGNGLACIEGLAGTGKSHLLFALKTHFEENGYRLRAFGPDNATVKVLREKGFTDTKNVHEFLFKDYFSGKKFKGSPQNFASYTPRNNKISVGKEVWVIDEAGKLGNRPLAELLKLAEKNDISLIFSGSSAQLSSVERGGMFKVFCEKYGHVFLGEIQRQNRIEDREISKNLAIGNVSKAVDMISSTGGFVWCRNKEETLVKLVEKWNNDKIDFPYSTSLIIAHTNKEVRQINVLIHTVRQERGEVLKKEFECGTIFGNIRVSEGDWIEFRANPKTMKVKNGDLGVLVSASENKFDVVVDGRKVSFNPKEFTAFQLGYASTNFRSQGRTIDRCMVLYSSKMHQNLMHVAMSRHIQNVQCFISREDATCITDLKRQVAKKNEIENTLNYTTAPEIQELANKQQREKNIDKLCSSEEFLTRAKGYGFKAWDSLKSHVGNFYEKVEDRRSNKDFYDVDSKPENGGGRVVEIKEEKLSIPNIEKGEEISKDNKTSSNKSSNFQKLPDDKKLLYRNYFDKTEKAASFYAIVQSESTERGISKELTPSFSDWQKACVERNSSAFDLLRGGLKHKEVLGQKSLDILQDRALRYEQSIQSKDSIEDKLKDNLDGLLYKLFPEGPQRRDSRGFRFGSKGSLSVACVGKEKGLYFDHENKEGGNLLKLIEKKQGLSHTQAKEWAHSFLQGSQSQSIPSHFSTARFTKVREETWISLMPVKDMPAPNLKVLSPYLDANYTLAAKYPYYDSNEQLICYTLRLESKKDGKKIVLPLSFGKSHPESESRWALKRYSKENELIYNSHLLQQNLNKPVLIVEGEKTADAANKVLGKDYIVISWLGGAGAAKSADWQQLFGRDITIWPDNDPSGFKAANDICSALRHVGVKSLKAISSDTLKDLPAKWDLADQLPSTRPQTFVKDCLLLAESKAIGIDQLKTIAAQHNMELKQLNEIVANIDDKIRPELERQHGSKTWEIDSAIQREVLLQFQEKGGKPLSILGLFNQKILKNEIKLENEH